jgi:YcaO-like protein with predicted kinase domain
VPVPPNDQAPAALLRELTRGFSALGITRLADQTGLDRGGVPCFAAIRPNSATVTVHQGKGLDPMTARISAVMEAAEYRFAEAPAVPSFSLSRKEAAATDRPTMSVTYLMPPGWTPDAGADIDWLAGELLSDSTPILVPGDALIIGTPPRQHAGISQSTNGLAAGVSRLPAMLHGLCEVIERDAICLTGFRSDATMAQRCLDPSRFESEDLDRLVERLRTAGLRVTLFDVTTDIGVPCFYALVAPETDLGRHVDTGTGAACHPVAAVAAIRAVIEAAQTRVSLIAGARDDIARSDYGAQVPRGVSALVEISPGLRPPPTGLPPATPLPDQCSFIQSRLVACGHGEALVVPLGGQDLGIDVLRVFVPGLEDRLTNRNWRPGPRAARAMLGLI